MVASGLLVAGTSSDAGKSLLVAGLCRAFNDRGIDVVPFKAQNMSNNSYVGADGELGRAQYAQALAARVTPTTAMNPVLLKPGTDRRSHIIVRGQPAGVLEAGQYATGRTALREAAWAAYSELAATHELVICEGAGSPAEINLRAGDYVNFGLAEHFNLPTVVVGDIDRGGILAALYGTWAVVSAADRALIRGFIINKFRGDPDVLTPGLTEITRRTTVPFFGVVPWLDEVWLDGEDALTFANWPPPATPERLQIAVLALPRVSNATDLDALAAEPGVTVRVTDTPATVLSADIVIVPGTRSTLDDLVWLRAHCLDTALRQRAEAGGAILGICGGYQMLGHTIVDEVEGTRQSAAGLGLLPVRTDFRPQKTLATPSGVWGGHPVAGYEIHHGIVTSTATAVTASGHPTSTAAPDTTTEVVEPFLDGYRVGNTFGTIWHGIFESDEFRRAWLAAVAPPTSTWRPDATALGFGARREAMLDRLAAACETHLDLEGLLALTKGN